MGTIRRKTKTIAQYHLGKFNPTHTHKHNTPHIYKDINTRIYIKHFSNYGGLGTEWEVEVKGKFILKAKREDLHRPILMCAMN